jgi:type 1 glutamine amidotransferase
MKLKGSTPFTLVCAIALVFVAAATALPQQPGRQASPQRGRGGFRGFRGPVGPGLINGVQNETPNPQTVIAMEDNLPETAPAVPKRPRKILVLCKAMGFVHTNIPLAAATVKALGDKTGAWSTTITYHASAITASNLAQYDAVFLDNTTGFFLDDAKDPAVTAARRKALLDFVREGKGLIGVHAAGDSYHTSGFGPGPAGGPRFVPVAEQGTWPAFNMMIGGFFKWHWPYPQLITVKIDDPKSPLTAMFHDREFQIHDEIYTFAQDSYNSLKNIHELTSIDYSKMSGADKAKEPAATRRTDGDYALSWIRREGKGRVFYDALGHDEHVYADCLYLKQLLAGIQYALGDLAANDRPTER